MSMSRKNQQKSTPYWITPVIVFTAVFAVISLLVSFPPQWRWLGVGESQELSQETKETIDAQGRKTVTTIKHEQAKTAWDWLSLLGVPLSLALLAWWLQQLEQKRTEDSRREDALKDYLASMSDLLIDGELSALAKKKAKGLLSEKDEKQFLLDAGMEIIRARTLSILRKLTDTKDPERIDKERKARVLLFLYEADLILRQPQTKNGNQKSSLMEKSLLNLEDADFSYADLSCTILIYANLSRVNLSYADLSNAILWRADFSGATEWPTSRSFEDLWYSTLSINEPHNKGALKDAILWLTDLSAGANLSNANLHGAILIETNLIQANLSGADLSGAIFWLVKHTDDANFSNANLHGTILLSTDLRSAKGLSRQQFEGGVEEKLPLLCNVALPPDLSHYQNRDCDRLPAVLHNRYPKAFKDIETSNAFVNKSRQVKWN